MEMIVWGLQFYKKPLGLNKGVIQRFGGAMTFPEISISQPSAWHEPLDDLAWGL